MTLFPTNRLKRIILAGPTGIGKTAISLELASQLPVSIISADSRQCYRHLDIGTGKVTPGEAGTIPHYNLSILDPTETDTAARFINRCNTWLDEIHQRNHLPLYVGGSTLHLQSIIWPLDEAPEACVQNLVKLRQHEESKGKEAMVEWLSRVDPDYLQQIDGYNPHRLYRALDVYLQTGKPFSSFHNDTRFDSLPEGTALIVLTMDRTQLVRRIESRINQMITLGLVEETKNVLASGCPADAQALQTVGYKEIIAHLNGQYDLDTAIKHIKTSTRRYAKRQVTWFKRWKAASFIDISSLTTSEATTKILSEIPSPF
jgi:tRNA dimethylallyltransferase